MPTQLLYLDIINGMIFFSLRWRGDKNILKNGHVHLNDINVIVISISIYCKNIYLYEIHNCDTCIKIPVQFKSGINAWQSLSISDDTQQPCGRYLLE